jgi:hypothetical protein
LAKGFEVAAGTFRHGPELQEYVLIVTYNLTQLKLDDSIIVIVQNK